MTFQTPFDQARRLPGAPPPPRATSPSAQAPASASSSSPASGGHPSPPQASVPLISYPVSPKTRHSGMPEALPIGGSGEKPPHVRTHSFQDFRTVPRPPPLRTALSAMGPVSALSSSSGMQRTASDAADDSAQPSPFRTPGGGIADDRDELTTKGRKRKRLAKACSACHKNKRRCDGFAPCSNCEFSSRPCLYLNAQGEPIPPPRTREPSALPPRKDEAGMNGANGGAGSSSGTHTPTKDAASGWQGARRGSIEHTGPLGAERRMFEHALDSVEADPALSLELLGIFFRRVPPFSAMFHSPTFYHRLYTGKASTLLLDAMYAFAARHTDHAALLGCFPADFPAHLRGEPFAERARAAADSLLKARRGWTEEQARLDRGTWEETEVVQALSLLSIYYACMRQSQLALYFLDISIAILRPTSMATLPPPATHLGLDKVEYLTLLETRNRTFWLVLLHDLCAAANGRQRRLGDHEIYNIPLPGPETLWARWGGAAAGGRDPGRREGLTPGSGNWKGEEGKIGEIGHVMRVLSIFSDIMTVANNTGGGPHPPQEHEQALKHWALSLPSHLRFDEINLSLAISKLASPLPEVALMGWLYAYMHAVAECGMFYLQAAIAQKPGPSYAAQRQSQAVDNIAVILDALGPRGREGPLLIFPIAVVSNWHDHLRASAASPSSQQMMLGERLAVWWAEMHREWGQERAIVAERGIYSTPQPVGAAVQSSASRPSPSGANHHRLQHLLEPPSTGLGLYQPGPTTASPKVSAADSGSSSSSSHNLPTPSSMRSQHSSLPYVANRPRAISSVLPAYHARSPSPPPKSSASAASRHRHMPSLSSLSDSQGHITLPPLNDLRAAMSPTNRYHPYSFSFDERSSNAHRSQSNRDRPVSPKGMNGRSWPEPLGIAALVTAAEREREREGIPA